MIDHEYIEQKGFYGRINDLESVKRFYDPYFETMFYRTNVALHTLRCSWLVNELNQTTARTYGSSFNQKKAILLSLTHDDTEIITTDKPLYTKERMSPAEKVAFEEEEIHAIKILAGRFPKQIDNFTYEELLNEARKKKSPEMQVVKYADYADALCEAI